MKNRWKSLICVLFAGLMQAACQSGGGGGGSASGGPAPAPGPSDPPRIEETVISRLSKMQKKDIFLCTEDFRQFAADQWNVIGPGYLVACLYRSARVTNSDWSRQFERDFAKLFSEFNQRIQQGVNL